MAIKQINIIIDMYTAIMIWTRCRMSACRILQSVIKPILNMKIIILAYANMLVPCEKIDMHDAHTIAMLT